MRQVLTREVYPYRELAIPKTKGGLRLIHSPEPDLMNIQRRILDSTLNQIVPHPCAMAYRPGYSVLDCARQHLEADTVVRLDISDFFPSIRERHVFNALLTRDSHGTTLFPSESWSLKPYARLSAYQVALLLTVSPPGSCAWINRGTGTIGVDDQARRRRFAYRGQREGFLPQGAPTSGAVSNLVMREVDEVIYRVTTDLRLRYTRYSDDLYFSSRKPINSDAVEVLVRAVRKALEPVGLRLNDTKTRVARRGSRRSVLGILVDGPTPRLPREFHREIDLHLRGADRNGLAKHASHRGFASVEKLDAHVNGLISWSREVEPARGEEQLAHWRRSVQRSREASEAAKDDQALDIAGAASPEQLARESIDRLLADGRVYRQSKDYAEFLSFVGRFRQYSPFNAAMVKLQKPGARFVATDRVWLNEHRRVLRPGARPLVIMQPRGPYMVVYDVSDTEALPGSPRLPADVTDPLAARSQLGAGSVQRLWDTTVDNAVRDGFRVTLVDSAPSHAGSASWSKRRGTISRSGPRTSSPREVYPLIHEIQVSRGLAPVDRYVTLVHELAHLYCGHLGTPDPKRWASRLGGKVRDEVEAESIAYIVMSRLDPTFAMGDYLLGYLDDSNELPEGVSLRLMIVVATQIMKMGERRLRGTDDVGAKETLF